MFLNLSFIYNRLHFYFGNIYRCLTIPLYQKNIKLENVCTIFCASFGKNGWHHIIKTLEEYDANPQINYKQTSMYLYLKYFTPQSTFEFDSKNEDSSLLPLFTYPWGTFKKDELFSNKNPNKSRFCGPSEDQFIYEEFDRTIKLYHKIKKVGYQPWRFGNTFIGGTFLINNRGDEKFVVLQGNHRMAILAHLNYRKIKVREVKGYLRQIKEKDIDNWLLVKAGKCTHIIAKNIFTIFFAENGNHIIKLLKK